MKRYLLGQLLILLVGLTTFSGYSQAQTSGDLEESVLAVVNADTISVSDLLAELGSLHSGQAQVNRSRFDVDKLLNRLINDRLLIQEARLLEMDQYPEIARRVEKFRFKAAREQLWAETLVDTFQVNEPEIQAYYVEQYRQFRLFLLTLTERQQADSLLRLIRRGAKPEDFAAQFSTELFRYAGGDRGYKFWFQLDDILQAELQQAQVGEMRGPFLYHNAHTLLKLLDSKPADSSHLETQRERVLKAVKSQKRRAVRESFLADLKTKYPVKVDSTLLENVTIERDSSAAPVQDDEMLVASVGSAQITLKTLKYKLMHSGSLGSPEMIRLMKPGVLEELIQDSLLQFAVQAQDVSQRPEVIAQVVDYEDSLLLVTYLNEAVESQIQFSPAEIDSFYIANRPNYRTPDQIKFSQITLTNPDTAEVIKQRLQEGASFDWLAKNSSTDQYKTKGGERGWLNLASFPNQMRTDLDSAKVHQIVGPYTTSEGAVLLQVQDRKPGEIMGLDQVKGRVQQELYQARFNQILDQILADLRSRSQITTNQKALQSISLGAQKN